MMDRMGLDKDSIMIIHMGGAFLPFVDLHWLIPLQGTFNDKEATLLRFRENYAKLSENIKARLVLENDEVRLYAPLLCYI